MKKIIEVRAQAPTPGEKFCHESQTHGICTSALILREGFGYEPISSYLEGGCLTIDVLRVSIV
jgi:hypothetical protein